jgi:hypothetical protein
MLNFYLPGHSLRFRLAAISLGQKCWNRLSSATRAIRGFILRRTSDSPPVSLKMSTTGGLSLRRDFRDCGARALRNPKIAAGQRWEETELGGNAGRPQPEAATPVAAEDRPVLLQKF